MLFNDRAARSDAFPLYVPFVLIKLTNSNTDGTNQLMETENTFFYCKRSGRYSSKNTETKMRTMSSVANRNQEHSDVVSAASSDRLACQLLTGGLEPPLLLHLPRPLLFAPVL